MKISKKELAKAILFENYENLGPQPGYINYGRFDRPIGKPIKPDENASANLFEKLPPVEDPNYFPNSVNELGLAAYALTKKVKGDNVENFYRKLQKLMKETDSTNMQENHRLAKSKMKNRMSEAANNAWFPEDEELKRKLEKSKYYGVTKNPYAKDLTFDKSGNPLISGMKIEKETPGFYDLSIKNAEEMKRRENQKYSYKDINDSLGNVYKGTSGMRAFINNSRLKYEILHLLGPSLFDELETHAQIDFSQTVERLIKNGALDESQLSYNLFRNFFNNLYLDDVYAIVEKELRNSIFRYFAEEIFGFQKGFKPQWLIDTIFKYAQVILQFEEKIKKMGDPSMKDWLDKNFTKNFPQDFLEGLDEQDIETFKTAILNTTMDDIFSSRLSDNMKAVANTAVKSMLKTTNIYLETGKYLPADIRQQNKALLDALSGKVQKEIAVEE